MISYFDEEYRFLSNFFSSPVEFEGLLYPCVENAYQAAKTDMKEMRKMFVGIGPGLAKKLGKDIELRLGWEDMKEQIMEELLRKKFEIPILRKYLLATGTQELIEGNFWGDTFWGAVWDGSTWEGQNHQGKLLMKIRSELSFSAV